MPARTPGHLAIARLEQLGHLCGVVTQNIDGLHQMAGSSNVIEIHGTTRVVMCVSCEAETTPRGDVGPHRGRARRPPPAFSAGGPVEIQDHLIRSADACGGEWRWRLNYLRMLTCMLRWAHR